MRLSRSGWWFPVALVLLLAGMVVAAGPDNSGGDQQLLKAAGVANDGPGLLEFFRRRTINDTDLTDIKELIRQLGDESFSVRQKASAALVARGAVCAPLLRAALKDPDIEIVRRAEDALHAIEEIPNAALVPAAARLIAVRKPAGAVEALLSYLPHADDEGIAEAVRSALAALAVPDGKPDPALVAALADKVPARRAGAAVALCRAAAEQRPAVKKLLQDGDPTVRLRAGFALAVTGDKEALPVLIDVLADLPPAQTVSARDLLSRLAEEKSPALPPGTDEASRRKYRDAWAAWWGENGDKTDLARVNGLAPMLGYTMIIMLDLNKVMELDADNKPRWQIDDLNFPLDAQLLPGERVLVTENYGNRITERNLKGDVLWEFKVDMPLMAQRLPNGHTFIGSRGQLLEIDRDGKEVFSHARPNGEQFMRAQKLANGDIAFVTAGHRFVRMDTSGKELVSFPVDIQTYGGRIEVLPNGRVLVPQYSGNKVAEHDPAGRVQWEANFDDQPIAAVRLANGSTMVTCLQKQRAVELDRAGKVIWEFKGETRVTRAWRR
jgi:HEAT repeat protein